MSNEHDLSPILVTGAHRSGTTWVGKMLAADANTAYISEPLNMLHRPGVFKAKVKHWYQYISDENESEYLPAFNHLLEYDYFLWDEIRAIRSQKDFLRMGRDFLTFYNALERGQRALLKDPFAVFSAPWFAKRLNCKIVFTIRHPAAFASSLQRLNWKFNFDDLLGQSLLMRDHLELYRKLMRSTSSENVIQQAALLWKIIYATVDAFRQAHPEWIIVKHEVYALDPINKFRDLYASLGLEFTHRVEQEILNSSNSENPTELSLKKTHSVKMDSAGSIKTWLKRLSKDDVNRIRVLTEGVSELFYSDKDWV